ncbi:MAG: hypothetical protein UW44_C0008G0082 [Candidatus Collierbacteria bacterium GW2011_GWB2_44_22]|uniref:Uncharacterized protein n=1 Tax=Candidatus Collierbacteria bacterium GW2011_GWB2_44_22 TaxID=1618387 RepID=A0A0G1HXU4_9BACT|nr:MAG: hypothetical protein UW44_C0008G0082 [Candidatus Collierbacteria bacterium GW2011_GWB2_44_22]
MRGEIEVLELERLLLIVFSCIFVKIEPIYLTRESYMSKIPVCDTCSFGRHAVPTERRRSFLFSYQRRIESWREPKSRLTWSSSRELF